MDQKRITSVTCGSGQTGGEDYMDHLTVVSAKFIAPRFQLFKVTARFRNSNADGVFGMASSENACSGFTTLFKSLVTPKKVAVKEFAFYLGRAASSTEQKSELTLGGRDFSG